MHALNDLNNQNSKTLKDAKNIRKDDGCSQNGMDDQRKSVRAGGSSPFFVDDDLMVAWEFEVLFQKEDETLEN